PVAHVETGVATGLLHQPHEVASDAFGLELGGQIDVEHDDPAVSRERRRSGPPSCVPGSAPAGAGRGGRSRNEYSQSRSSMPPAVTTPVSASCVHSPFFTAEITFCTSLPTRGPSTPGTTVSSNAPTASRSLDSSTCFTLTSSAMIPRNGS